MMHAASRPPVPGGVPMGPPLANGPSQGPGPMTGEPRMPAQQPSFIQQPVPYPGATNGVHPHSVGQLPSKLGQLGPQQQAIPAGQPFVGSVPARPPSVNGPPHPLSQPGMPPVSHSQIAGPPSMPPPRPGSSQGYNNLGGPPGPGSVGQPSSGNPLGSFALGPSSSPTPPPNNGPYQPGMQQAFPGGQGFPPNRPSPSPMPQMSGPPLGQGGLNLPQPLSNNAPGGPTQMGPYSGASTQISGQMGGAPQTGVSAGGPPNFGPPGAPIQMGGMGSMSAQGYPQPPRPQHPSGPGMPGMGYNHSQPPSLNQPGMGPPRPGLPPGPSQFPQGVGGQPIGLSGPQRHNMGAVPGIPPSMPPGPGMHPQMPPGPGMHPQMPPGPGMHPQMPPGPGMHPQMPPGPGMHPQMPPGPGMHPQMPPGPGMQPQMPPGPGLPPQPGGYNTQMGPGQMNSPGRRSLDPDQMPSPIAVMEDDQTNNGGTFQTKEKGMPPPLVTTKFVCQDFGNATPRFIRSTMYTVPASEDLRKQSGVPFALIVTPMAKVAEGEQEPPVTDFGPSGPVRCVRCKAYMCPYMQFIDGGRRFQCAFCKATTEVPADYFQHLDHTGVRMDCYQRPELCLGTYECVATKDYCRDSREPNTPGIIFAIDVSYPMIKEGIVQLICANIKSMIADLPRDSFCDKDQMRVGFITYDKKINFYNIKSNLTQPQQLTVGDVDDMFVPLVDGLMCNVKDSEAVIDSLLEQIPLMFAETRETETILAPVVQAGKEAFKAANCAGKLVIFHHNLPVAEAPGKLKNRDDRKVLGTDKEKAVLVPQVKDYNNLGQECVGVGCSVDMFVFNNAYIDVATISQVCRLSGGQLYKYTYFQPDVDGERFLADLRHNLCRPVVFDAIMRVRTSTGVRPVEFYGNFFMANTTDTEVASLNSDMAVACEIKYDDKLTEEDGVFIQVAILFTSCSGQRRLRVINLSLKTSASMADMYRNCELDTIINFQAKQSMQKLMESNPKSVKEGLIANCAQILACYRKNCASPSSAGQLILPECMKLLPLYTNCLLKSDALSGGADVGCDDRAYLMHSLGSMDVSSTVAYFYPRLIPLHNLPEEPDVTIPHPLRCTIEKVTDNGVYLLENGIYMFMYIGLTVDPGWVQAVFGVQGNSQINLEKSKLEERDNPTSIAVRRVIELIRKERQRNHMRLVLVRQRDKLDVLFRHFLCEDRGSPGSGAGDFNFSYVDFLMHMHKEIRALLS